MFLEERHLSACPFHGLSPTQVNSMGLSSSRDIKLVLAEEILAALEFSSGQL